MCRRKYGFFEIIAGTYEEFLLGYVFYEANGEYKLEQTFADHSHKASIRTLAMYQNKLASGGADEIIHLYDLVTRRETGILVQHTGTVTSLSFTPDGAFLVSGSEDGSLTMFRVATWFLEKVWPKAHKGSGINSVSIHPSGKLALTVGNDKVLRTWNLIKGRKAYATNIARKSKRPEGIFWSNDGDYYVLPYETKLDIYKIDIAGVIHSLELPSKISCIVFLEDDIMCIGTWDGTVFGYSCNSAEELWKIETGKSRVKALATCNAYSKLVSANSDGILSVYDSSCNPPKFLASTETCCRITCLVAGDPYRQTKPKKIMKVIKRKSLDEESTPKRKKMNTSTEVQCSPKGQKWKVELIK